MIKSNNTLFSILGSKVNYFFLKIKVGDRALIPTADFDYNYFKKPIQYYRSTFLPLTM